MKILENTPNSLYEIYRHFKEGRWSLPSHQRKLVWNKGKMLRWFKDLVQLDKNGGGTVPGCIIIYTLPADPDRTFLNDGAQRVHWTIIRFIEWCKEYNHNWKDILQSVKITVQKVDYKDVKEAIGNFIQINCGTTATPYELTRTLFCECFDDWEDYWEPKIQRIHKAVERGLIELGCHVEDRYNTDKRDTSHKRMRDEYHIFWKVISGDDSMFSPKVASSNLKPDDWLKASKLEKNLLELLQHLGYNGINDALNKFDNFITNNVAFFKQIWLEKKSPLDIPSNVHVRWWLITMAYLENKNVSKEIKREFTSNLIDKTDGRTTLFYENDLGVHCNCNLAMSALNHLGMIFKLINIDPIKMGCPNRKRKGKKVSQLRSGFHHSHILGYSATGDTATIPENAIENLHRSARDMTENEKNRLSKINEKRITIKP